MRTAAMRLMKRAVLRALLTAASVAVIATLAFAGPGRAVAAEKPTAPVTRTNVVIYEPSVPSGPAKKGSCWTGSIAVLRKGAWRCMLGNAIYDPCFSIASRPGAVVCGADPATARPGFVVELTKPLPAPDLPAQVKPEPWIMQLADGTVCEKMTGTIAFVDGQPIPWGCNDSAKRAKPGAQNSYSGILGKPKQGKVWTIEKVRYMPTPKAKRPFKLVERKTVAVRTVWK